MYEDNEELAKEYFTMGFKAGVNETRLNLEAGPDRFDEFLREQGID